MKVKTLPKEPFSFNSSYKRQCSRKGKTRERHRLELYHWTTQSLRTVRISYSRAPNFFPYSLIKWQDCPIMVLSGVGMHFSHMSTEGMLLDVFKVRLFWFLYDEWKVASLCLGVALSSTLLTRNMFDGCIFCEAFKYNMQSYFINLRWNSARKSPFLTMWKRKINNPCGETKLWNVRCAKVDVF